MFLWYVFSEILLNLILEIHRILHAVTLCTLSYKSDICNRNTEKLMFIQCPRKKKKIVQNLCSNLTAHDEKENCVALFKINKF